MAPLRPLLVTLGCASAALGACRDDGQSPPARPEPPAERDTPDGSTLEPLDLVYVCGNKFLATNATTSAIHVTYRVVGTRETGGLTLREGPGADPGYSETELETTARGVVELFHNDARVARRRNLGTTCGGAAVPAPASAMASVEAAGEWSAPFSWPVVALHVSLLPDGRVLSWGHYGTPQLWDPTTGGFTGVPSPALIFCAGHSLLADGRLLVSGGHISDDHGLPDNNLFTAATGSWSVSTPMQRGRWYPTNTTLGSGDVVILAGRDENGVVVKIPEVWSGGSVRALTGASRNLPYYPRAFLAPNGRVFYAGELQTTRYLNPTGAGYWTLVGERLYGTRDYGAAVMYDDGKILYAGGGRTTNTAEIIDLNAPAPAWQWTGSMATRRRHLNATVLPTGEVLATGGSSGTAFNDVGAAVRTAELWSPLTGAWTTLASNTVGRTYHSASILLPDGRVLHTGSGDGAGAPNEKTAELFSPPYLSRGPRPAITAAPAAVGYGTTFSVATDDAGAIRKVSLVRLGSTTHGFDMNQRFQWLTFSPAAGALSVSAPKSRNRTPPGHYLLFVVDTNDVPSVGAIVRIGSDAEIEPPPNVPPTAAFTSSCSGLSCTFADRSTDTDGSLTAWLWAMGDGGSSTLRNPSHTFAAPGTYAPTLTVTDDDGATHQQAGAVTVSDAIALRVTGRVDSTKHYMTLTWTGASGAAVDVHRDGRFLTSTPNDGKYTNSRNFIGPATYVYKVCETGSAVCSNEASVTFR